MASLIVLWAAPVRSQTPPAEVFPLEPGRVWTYAGTVRWTAPRAPEVQEKEMEWRMEVLEVVERLSVRAAVLRGHPLDLVWYEEGRTRGRYLLIQVGAGSYYLLGGEEAAKAERRLRDPADPLTGLVQPHQLFLDAPLWPDKRFCGSESFTREDGLYCWVVEAVDTVILEDITGVLPRPLTTYRIALRTLGEHDLLDVVPGIGLIAFTFGHHGTVSEVEVRLVAVEPTIPGERGSTEP